LAEIVQGGKSLKEVQNNFIYENASQTQNFSFKTLSNDGNTTGGEDQSHFMNKVVDQQPNKQLVAHPSVEF
jgi:hypothetical protein